MDYSRGKRLHCFLKEPHPAAKYANASVPGMPVNVVVRRYILMNQTYRKELNYFNGFLAKHCGILTGRGGRGRLGREEDCKTRGLGDLRRVKN